MPAISHFGGYYCINGKVYAKIKVYTYTDIHSSITYIKVNRVLCT